MDPDSNSPNKNFTSAFTSKETLFR
uniref:Uncharacterized protein n=1 Tax=Arundo donax TaxID=35708 RepID=A0A0A9BHF4_ARUDO